MVAFYALLAAVLFGSGDFLGGRATQRPSILSVLATSHLIGLVLILVMAPLMAERFDGGDFALGMGASGFGLLGLVLLYRGLARGPMAGVAPVTAVTCAALPVLWGVAFGNNTFVAVGTAGYIVRSTDNGLNWDNATTDNSTVNHLQAVTSSE